MCKTADRVTNANWKFSITTNPDQSIISVDGWECGGNELKLSSCDRGNSLPDCDHGKVAGVFCFGELKFVHMQ